MLGILSLIALATNFSVLVEAHTVITYPPWRGDNLHMTSNVTATNGLGTGQDPTGNIMDVNANGDITSGEVLKAANNFTYPYGMQWMYPCGGIPLGTNRTKWPVNGGAIAIQPGWFTGHATAFFYINMGFGTLPPNMSFPMVPAFQITGPTKEPYPGTFCLPQVPLPANASVKVGDNATIQVIETAVHGAALYNCADITFANPEEVPQVNSSNCFNSTDIGFNLVFTTTSLSKASSLLSRQSHYLASIPLLAAVALGFT
ncbi:MAG: hypothetical protein M1835_008026 [Candelina submexicana]|nr:MAG: hypothetical protein M1835_008026 [Candelina submexicana]